MHKRLIQAAAIVLLLLLTFPIRGADFTLFRHPSDPISVPGPCAFPGAALSASTAEIFHAGWYRWVVAWTPGDIGQVELVSFDAGLIGVVETFDQSSVTPIASGAWLWLEPGFYGHRLCWGAKVYSSIIEEE